jgi:hypothetical protein
VVVVLNFKLLFPEEELSPAPKGLDTDGTVSVIWAQCMFSKASSSSAFSFLMLCGFLVGGGRCSVKNNGFVKFMKNGIQVSSH